MLARVLEESSPSDLSRMLDSKVKGTHEETYRTQLLLLKIVINDLGS